MINSVLKFCSMLEGATGLALIAAPALVCKLLFGAELEGVGIAAGRVAGLGLLSLGTACWVPGTGAKRTCPCPLYGMLTYNALVALYFAWLGVGSVLRGILLWPVVVLHVSLTALLVRAATKERSASQIKDETAVKGAG